MKRTANAFRFLLFAGFLCAIPATAQPVPEGIRLYDRGANGGYFEDVTWTASHQDPGLAACGSILDDARNDRWNYMTTDFWLVVTDHTGQQLINRTYRDDGMVGFHGTGHSIIDCDDGGYLIGGMVQRIDTLNNGVMRTHFTMFKLDAEADVEWWNYYGSPPTSGWCRSVIELKNNDYAGCGWSKVNGQSGPYVIIVDADGEVIWEQVYPGIVREFYAMRETEGGLLIAGYVYGDGDVRHWILLKTDFEGEIVWLRDEGVGTFYDLVSNPRGGYAACGTVHDEGGRPEMLLTRFDINGEVTWSRRYDVSENDDIALKLTSLADGGFMMVGKSSPNGRSEPLAVRTDAQGNLMWVAEPNTDWANVNYFNSFDGIVLDGNRTPVIAGYMWRSNRGGWTKGMLLWLPSVTVGPNITGYSPTSPDTTILTGERIAFSIQAEDQQEDSLMYRWELNGEVVSERTSVAITFPAVANYDVKCVVSDGEYADSVEWVVHAVELYISAFSPDTLNLTFHRGASADFSLDTIRFTDGADPEILWTKTNQSNGQVDVAGSETHATITFPWSGDYTVEGTAYHGESSDAVLWSVAVRGVIWAFVPEPDSLDVPYDSIVHFEIVPSLPDDESLYIEWLMDGELVRDDTTAIDLTFSPAEQGRQYQIQAIVADSVETDTVTWTVNVRQLDVEFPTADPPRSAVLLSVTPNPFNSSVRISFAAINRGKQTLTIHDITGREVFSTVRSPHMTENASVGYGEPTVGTVTWDASIFPAGIYFARLASGNDVQTVKMVLVR